jgi:hypothetical protein
MRASQSGYQVRKKTLSNAWARKIPAPTRPISAVTVSIIANILCEPRGDKTTWHPAQSKGFPKHKTESKWTEDSAQQRVPNQSNNRLLAALSVPRVNTCTANSDLFTIARLSPFPPCSGCGILATWCEADRITAGCRCCRERPRTGQTGESGRRKWSAKVVIGGEWGFGCQIGSSGQREARPAR